MAKEAKITLHLFHWPKVMHLGLRAKSVAFIKILGMVRNLRRARIAEPVHSSTRSYDIAAAFGESGYFYFFFRPEFPFFHHELIVRYAAGFLASAVAVAAFGQVRSLFSSSKRSRY